MVTQYKEILSNDLFEKLLKHLEDSKLNQQSKFTTSYTFWQKHLINTSVPVIRYNFDNVDSIIYKELKNELESKIPYHVLGMSYHLWPSLSYITWHNDSKYSGALTIYLNEEWDSDWGGYLMYEDNNEIRAIKPEKNLGVFQKTPLRHCVTTINIGAPIRQSLQVFFDKDKSLI